MVPWLLLQHICPGLLVLAPCERHWKRHSIYLDFSIVVKTSLARREFPAGTEKLWETGIFGRTRDSRAKSMEAYRDSQGARGLFNLGKPDESSILGNLEAWRRAR
jgi:hypothetical protein